MEKIICEKCKNAYLQKNEEGYFCSSCGMFHPNAEENLLLGIHCYKEGRLDESADYLMKAIVSDGSNYKALLYKALGDGLKLDEDSTSLADVYEQIIFAVELVPDSDFPNFLEIANDEAERLELALAKIHLADFETADAEKIKSLVTVILKIQEEALKFRNKLADFADAFNKRNGNSIIYNRSKCFLVTPEIANEIGAKKLNKIKADIASHTVFTGILTTDIRNLEIYYRCIVMFFEKNKDKYDYLMQNAENFVVLANILEEGNYTAIQGTAATAEKLKITAYSFFEESLKGEEAEETEENTKSVIVINEEIEEAAVLDNSEATLTEDVADDIDEKPSGTVEIEEIDITEHETVIEEITEITDDVEIEEVSAIEEQPAEEIVEEKPTEDLSFKDTPVQQHNVNAPILEADNVQDLPNTNVVIGDIFNSGSNKSASEDSPFNYSANTDDAESSVQENESEKAEKDEVSDEDLEAAKTARTQEYPELSQEEKDDIARHERFKKIKVVNTDDEDFKALASRFDRARKNDPDRETTLVPKKNRKKPIIIAVVVFVVAVIAINAVRFLPEFIAETRYNSALELIEENNYTEAIAIFEELGEYQDSEEKILECKYQNALLLIDAKDYSAAKSALEELKGYNSDIETKIQLCDYSIAKNYLEKGKYDKAQELFTELKDYGDSADMVKECSYRNALSLIESKKYEEAIEILSKIKKYSDSSEKINEAKYLYVTENLSAKNETTVKYLTELAKIKYRNSADLKQELLGTSSDSSLKFFVNTSSTDTETSLDSVSHLRSAYFHVIALDELYYGEKLTLKYTTQYDYSSSSTVTFSEDNTSAIVVYPPTSTSGYTVTFSIHSADGATIGSQKITIS